MKKTSQSLKKFLSSPVGAVVAFLVIFYVLTFAVYYFYSPGPEERRQAQSQNTAAERVRHANQTSSIQITTSSTQETQLILMQ